MQRYSYTFSPPILVSSLACLNCYYFMNENLKDSNVKMVEVILMASCISAGEFFQKINQMVVVAFQ